MKLILIFAAAMAAAFPSCFAAGAAFSKDNGHVYLVATGTSELVDIDLAAKSWRTIGIDLPARDRAIQGVTLSNAGFILCATSHAVWSFDPSNGKCAKVCDAPQGVTFQDIAYDPTTEIILTVAVVDEEDGRYGAEKEASAFCLLKGAKEPADVRIRYGTKVGHPVFTADGTLFFECSGDLWMGCIYDGNNDLDDPALALDAYRCAPFASLIEQDITPPSTGLEEIAVTGRFVYARYARMGGSGWGSMVRFQRPPPFSRDSDGARQLPYEQDWKGLERRVASVESIAPTYYRFLCASRDGSLVFYADPFNYTGHFNPDDVFLVKHDGTPVPIEIKGLGSGKGF